MGATVINSSSLYRLIEMTHEVRSLRVFRDTSLQNLDMVSFAI